MKNNKILIHNFYDYLNTINYLSSIPKWKVELFFYTYPIPTLPDASMDAAHKALKELDKVVITKKKGIKSNAELCL